MFVFGHIGIGRKLASLWRRDLPIVPFVVGALLPDLIDKPLYYARFWDYISCTRTFGHTGVLLMLILIAAYVRRSRALTAVGVAIATHLALDFVMDGFSHGSESATWLAITWPLLYPRFAHFYFASVPTHLSSLLTSKIAITELIGLALIAWDYSRRRI